MNYRNRSLLDLAYQIPCTLQIEGVCEGGVGEPAHSNQSRHGKGRGLKAHDAFFASSCRACHRELDQGKNLTREERADIWQRGFERTVLAMWRGGLIVVAQWERLPSNDRPVSQRMRRTPRKLRSTRTPVKIVPRRGIV